MSDDQAEESQTSAPATRNSQQPAERTPSLDFPVVGVGASAGGLEAFSLLLSHLTNNTGMAFVLVRHLDPTHSSSLTQLLSKTIAMPVCEVTDGMCVAPNYAYVISTNRNTSMSNGALRLFPRNDTLGQNLPIDFFLRSLASDLADHGVGVILSGTASDGTMGLQATNEEPMTVNDELSNRNTLANQLNNDLVNLLASVNIPILMIDRNFCIRRFTPSAAKVFSLIPTDVGRPLGNIKTTIPDIELAKIAHEVIDSLSVQEREVQDADGRWYLLSIRPYKTSDNRIEGAVVALLDVDALKRSEQQIRESRDYAESIIDTVQESLLVLDANLRIKTANRSFYGTFQVSPAETEGRIIFELGDRQWDIPRLRTILDGIKNNHKQLIGERVEHVFPLIGHRVMLVNARRMESAHESTELILLAINDITGLVNAEQLQKEREITLKSVLNTAAEGIITIDMNANVLTFNKAAERMFGYQADEVIGKNVSIIMPSPYHEEHDRYLNNYQSTGVKRIIGIGREVRGLRKDGTVFPLQLSVSEIEGNNVGFTGILRDLTDLKAAQATALQAERLAAIGQMSAGLAHESGNALQRSQACLEMLALTVKDRPQSLELIARVQSAQDHLYYLYQDVRNYAASITLQPKPCNLGEIWREAWACLELLRQQKNATLKEDIAGVDLDCTADPFRLGQVFHNVLANALEAAETPAEVQVQATEVAIDGQSFIRIAIHDNGPGLGPEQRQRIFEPFYTTKAKGTGLGMAIVRRIVDAHGGWIAVDSKATVGATILLTLPRKLL